MMVLFFFLVTSWSYKKLTKRRLLQWGLKRQSLSYKIHQNFHEKFVYIKDIVIYGKKSGFLIFLIMISLIIQKLRQKSILQIHSLITFSGY
jgi:hypothetical protein